MKNRLHKQHFNGFVDLHQLTTEKLFGFVQKKTEHYSANYNRPMFYDN